MNDTELRNLILAAADKKIAWIDLSGQGIINLPPEVGYLTEVKVLDLSDNHLTNLPPEIGKLRNLTALYLGRNQLADLPAEIGKLPLLRKLDVSGNLLTTLPPEIGHLILLEQLEASFNLKMTTLPNEISQLLLLKQLGLDWNPIERPPLEVVSRGIQGIRNYFWQIESVGMDYLYEAKLIIVGEAGAGKTTLARKIQNPEYTLQPDVITEGIEITQWAFLMQDDKPFRVNIWDFGGHEIYHATHQFFLTKRSLYILVADTRREDTDFFYWLNLIELLSDKSPALIIKNEKQDRKRQINEHRLRGQFINLEKVLATNLATNRGLLNTLSEIKHYIYKLPHIGTPLPKTWVQVREILEQESQNHITLEEFLQVCGRSGFANDEDKMQLSKFLHDLGVCLHFQDDPLLRKLVILKPEWGTTAVYKVLDNSAVINNFGRFNRTDLANIWHEPQYITMHNELLQLMLNFKLCYRVPGPEEIYIAPQLLTDDQPHYDWRTDDNLNMRYVYEFMPKGIITHFIVALHHLIEYHKNVWKSGVILKKDQTKAEVIEYYDKREIKIQISGDNRKELMTVINYELDKIHAYYPQLKYAQLIPCNCSVCKSSHEPHFYRFNELKKRLGDKRYEIECAISYKMIDILNLLGNMVDKADWLEKERINRDLTFNPSQLLKLITEGFDEEELKDICFNSGVDYDTVPGKDKKSKAREIIIYFMRRNRLRELIKMGQNMRPDITWPKQIRVD